MPEHQEQSTEQDTLREPAPELADAISRITKEEMGRTAADALREGVRAVRGTIVATAAGAVLTAMGSALLLLGVLRWLEELYLPRWGPHAIAGGLGLVVGVMLCFVGRRGRESDGSDE